VNFLWSQYQPITMRTTTAVCTPTVRDAKKVRTCGSLVELTRGEKSDGRATREPPSSSQKAQRLLGGMGGNLMLCSRIMPCGAHSTLPPTHVEVSSVEPRTAVYGSNTRIKWVARELQVGALDLIRPYAAARKRGPFGPLDPIVGVAPAGAAVRARKEGRLRWLVVAHDAHRVQRCAIVRPFPAAASGATFGLASAGPVRGAEVGVILVPAPLAKAGIPRILVAHTPHLPLLPIPRMLHVVLKVHSS
jgi:hypothetical protein